MTRNLVTIRQSFAKACWPVVAVLIGISWAHPSFGQPPNGTEPQPIASDDVDDSSPNLLLKEEQPQSLKMFYLRTASGQLVPVPDMTFEDFSRLYKLDRKLTSAKRLPEFEMSQLVLDGKVTGNSADLTANITIRQMRRGTIRVPLKFSEAVLAQTEELQQKTRTIQFDAGNETSPGDGYVVWLKGDDETVHKLRLKLATETISEGGDTTIRMTLPSATSSEFQLDVPGSHIEATTNNKKRSVTVTPNGTRSILSLNGLSSTSTISWAETTRAVDRPRRVILEARGDHRVRVRGPGFIVTESQFRFFGRGGQLESVKLRLPPGTRITDEIESAEYSITPGSVDRDERQAVEVSFQEPDDRPRDVVIRTEYSVEENNSDDPVDVAGFEVVDAVRHYGRITLATDDAWLLRWQESTNIRRVAHDSAADGADTVAAFEYFRQQAKLPIVVRRKATRIQARTNAELSVLSNEMKMESTIDLRVSGAPASFTHISLPGWEIVEVETPATVAKDQIRLDESEPLVIPFRQPFTGDASIKVTARKAISLDEESSTQELAVRLPFVESAANSPVNVQLFTQPSLVVVPDDRLVEEIVDLGRTNAAARRAGRKTPVNEPSTYIFRGDPKTDAWVCSVQSKPQSVTGEIAGTVRVEPNFAAATFTIDASILHEPIDSFRFEFRDTKPLDVSVRLDGQPLDPSYHRWTTDAHGESATLAIQFPNSILGRCQLELEYDTAVEWTANKSQRGVSVPLPQTSMGDFRRDAITVQSSTGVIATLDGATWKIGESTSDRFTANNSIWTTDLPLLIMPQPGRVSAPSHIVERVFWQTWRTNDQRQDRVVYSVTTNEDFIELIIPGGVDLDSISTVVNGKLVSSLESDGRKLRLSLDRPVRANIVELFLPYSARTNDQLASLPQVVDAEWTRKLFWQVVIPSNEFIVAPPAGVESEDAWSMSDVLTGHASEIEQLWLENWAGGSHQVAPPHSTNRYVFSSFGHVPSIRMKTARRSSLLLFIAAAVFGLGALPTMIPALQRPAYLFGAAFCLAIAAMLFPIHTLVVAPAAAGGALLLAISRIIHGWKNQRIFRRHLRGSDSSQMRTGSSVNSVQAAPTTISSLPPLHVSAPDN